MAKTIIKQKIVQGHAWKKSAQKHTTKGFPTISLYKLWCDDVRAIKDMDSTSNTLKSLTNPHIIRGIAALKDVERFSKGHFERYREFMT